MMMTTAIQMIAKMMAMPTTVGSEDDDEDELLELRVSKHRHNTTRSLRDKSFCMNKYK